MIARRGRRHDGRRRRRGARPPIAGLTEADQRSVLYFLLFPNTLVSLHPDYVMLHTLWPREPDRTEVICEWFFEPRDDAGARLRRHRTRSTFWDQVNREDWDVCALTQLRHELAPLRARALHDARRTTCTTFDVMVADRYLEALGGKEVAS